MTRKGPANCFCCCFSSGTIARGLNTMPEPPPMIFSITDTLIAAAEHEEATVEAQDAAWQVSFLAEQMLKTEEGWGRDANSCWFFPLSLSLLPYEGGSSGHQHWLLQGSAARWSWIVVSWVLELLSLWIIKKPVIFADFTSFPKISIIKNYWPKKWCTEFQGVFFAYFFSVVSFFLPQLIHKQCFKTILLN